MFLLKSFQLSKEIIRRSSFYSKDNIEFKASILYVSKLSRTLSGNLPPTPCYAMGNLSNENILSTICDCYKECKFSPNGGIGCICETENENEYSFNMKN